MKTLSDVSRPSATASQFRRPLNTAHFKEHHQ